eukprot:scaffold19406_cov62-Phaeocystis_antarctica.AAC.1
MARAWGVRELCMACAWPVQYGVSMAARGGAAPARAAAQWGSCLTYCSTAPPPPPGRSAPYAPPPRAA